MDTSFYDKGFITYAGGGGRATKLLKRLEAETGIKFKKVDKKSQADFVFSKKDRYGLGTWGGGAYTYKRKGKTFIYVDPEATSAWRKMALRHEVGHALGISKHSDNPKDAMSRGSINRSKWYSKSELKFFVETWL